MLDSNLRLDSNFRSEITVVSFYPTVPKANLVHSRPEIFPPGRTNSKLRRSVYPFLYFEPLLGKSKEFNNQWMKVQLKIAFIIMLFFCHRKNNKKLTGSPCFF